MEDKVDFPTYRSYMISSLEENFTAFDFALHEPVRLLIWNLVQSLQEYHQGEECPQTVSKETVEVFGELALITGDCIPYDEENAMKNYKQLHDFLLNDLFNGCNESDLPYCVKKFLKLLVRTPLTKQHLIGWHVSHMSFAYTICFINNVAHCMTLGRDEVRSKIRLAIDLIPIEEHWENRFAHGYDFLKKMFERERNKAESYDTVNTSKRSYCLIYFLRDVLDHAGTKKRSGVHPSHWSEWWKLKRKNLSQGQQKGYREKFQGTSDEREVALNDLVRDIFILFSRFLTKLQHRLHREGLLEFVSPCPDVTMRY